MHYAGVAIVGPGSGSALQSISDRSSSLSSPAAMHWNTGTGASSDMTPHCHWFRSYSPHSISIRLANSHIVYSEGLGSVAFQPADNLLSVFYLTREKGYTVKLCELSVLFYHQGQLRFEAQVNNNNVSYLPLDDVDVPGGPEDTAPPENGVPGVPELHNQGGDDDYDDPAPPAPPAPPALPAPQPPPPPHQLSPPPRQPSLPRSPSPLASLPPAPPPVPSPSPPPVWPPPAPVTRPPAPSVHQEAQNCAGFRPYPALAHKELPTRSSHPQGSLNERVLEHQNLVPQRLCIRSASPAPPPLPEPERSSSPDPLIEAPVDAPAAPELCRVFSNRPRSPLPSPTSSDDELDLISRDSDEEALHAMLAGIEDVYSDPSFDYLSYDEALEVSFKSVAEQASKANQEHFGEPRSMSEVMVLEPEECNKWLKVAQDELQSLVKNGTFELVLLPSGRKAIGFWWVFWVKRNADGSIECYKGRLIAKGFSQRPGFEYNETFDMPKWTSIRAILALAALKDLELESVDISSAYLNGELKEEVYMCQPDGFEEKTPQWVWRLRKTLYGLKQAGWCWHEKLDKVLSTSWALSDSPGVPAQWCVTHPCIR
ncbi:hypothetical protein GSI_12425 [Ganoderma sinense ZZ0214-1]|uniref:Uncharacterized protein n=1 Tax=Ganoderma sinense ZZ0214-1 TaxID=1077348 RepID=A0A2G8RVK5_9APHY|nr:hypothetical protein GSI_12425 [Ganoderma sinense ZZ0214-1]